MKSSTKLLLLLRENARLPIEELARRTKMSVEEATAAIASFEERGVIRGYTAIIREDELDPAPVKALIHVRVTPHRDGGFDRVAERIARFPEVVDLVLVSGGFDLQLTIQGKSLQEVGSFVSSKLATIDGVISTSTGFYLKKYKEAGKRMQGDEKNERLSFCF
jgi:DNA-binding Lrp family transcriptional regulator